MTENRVDRTELLPPKTVKSTRIVDMDRLFDS